jgi:hypothetical protein
MSELHLATKPSAIRVHLRLLKSKQHITRLEIAGPFHNAAEVDERKRAGRYTHVLRESNSKLSGYEEAVAQNLSTTEQPCRRYDGHFSFAYSALVCWRIGMSG